MTVPDHMFKPSKIYLASKRASTHGTPSNSVLPSRSGRKQGSIARQTSWLTSRHSDGATSSSQANIDGEMHGRKSLDHMSVLQR